MLEARRFYWRSHNSRCGPEVADAVDIWGLILSPQYVEDQQVVNELLPYRWSAPLDGSPEPLMGQRRPGSLASQAQFHIQKRI